MSGEGFKVEVWSPPSEGGLLLWGESNKVQALGESLIVSDLDFMECEKEEGGFVEWVVGVDKDGTLSEEMAVFLEELLCK